MPTRQSIRDVESMLIRSQNTGQHQVTFSLSTIIFMAYGIAFSV